MFASVLQTWASGWEGKKGHLHPLDFGNILLKVRIILVLTINGYETIKITLKNLKHIKILTLSAVPFIFSAVFIVSHEFQTPPEIF